MLHLRMSQVTHKLGANDRGPTCLTQGSFVENVQLFCGKCRLLLQKNVGFFGSFICVTGTRIRGSPTPSSYWPNVFGKQTCPIFSAKKPVFAAKESDVCGVRGLYNIITTSCASTALYRVVTVSRIDKIVGLFCRISSLL